MVIQASFKTRPILFLNVLASCLAALLMGGPLALAGDQLGEMTVSHCSRSLCVKVVTDKGYQSPLDPQVTSFDTGTLEIHIGDHKGNPQLLVFEEGYIDLESRILVAKGLKNSPHQDLLLKLESGHFEYY